MAEALFGAAEGNPVLAAEYVRMSTDHQRYSIDNQLALIHAYAASNNMRIVQTYADPGRSGLALKHRPGLARLLTDIVAGDVPFQVVLVYDVSRWGRFQDADESAHYEYLCKRSGIRVIYCAEQFAGDSTPFASVLKALKRAMAGEFSRELSVKVAAGKARIGSLGFRVGGIAGYGLRRQVLEQGSVPGRVLSDGQRKGVQTDRVILVPGPEEEIRIIRRIYRDYIYLAKSEREISADLNAEGLRFFGRCWSRNLVRCILANEKYVGNNIVGRFCQRLRTRQVINPPEMWTRCDGAFQPVVPLNLFERAARVRRFNEKTYVTHQEILNGLAGVLKREGKITTEIINRAPELPSANTVVMRFGSLGRAYEALGYHPASRYGFHAVNRALAGIEREVFRLLRDALSDSGIGCEWDEHGPVWLSDAPALELLICRFQRPRSYQTGWRIAYQRTTGAPTLLACRMDPTNTTVLDFLLVPKTQLAELPLLIQRKHDPLVAPYRHADIKAVARTLSAATR